MEHVVTFPVAAPPAMVWEVLADVVRWPEWTESMTSVELPGGELTLGASAQIKQPRLPLATWTVTGLEPGRSFTWTSKGPGQTSAGVHTVEPRGDGSLVTLGMTMTGPVGRIVGTLYRGLIRRYVQLEADGLARTAEARARA